MCEEWQGYCCNASWYCGTPQQDEAWHKENLPPPCPPPPPGMNCQRPKPGVCHYSILFDVCTYGQWLPCLPSVVISLVCICHWCTDWKEWWIGCLLGTWWNCQYFFLRLLGETPKCWNWVNFRWEVPQVQANAMHTNGEVTVNSETRLSCHLYHFLIECINPQPIDHRRCWYNYSKIYRSALLCPSGHWVHSLPKVRGLTKKNFSWQPCSPLLLISFYCVIFAADQLDVGILPVNINPPSEQTDEVALPSMSEKCFAFFRSNHIPVF